MTSVAFAITDSTAPRFGTARTVRLGTLFRIEAPAEDTGGFAFVRTFPLLISNTIIASSRY